MPPHSDEHDHNEPQDQHAPVENTSPLTPEQSTQNHSSPPPLPPSDSTPPSYHAPQQMPQGYNTSPPTHGMAAPPLKKNKTGWWIALGILISLIGCCWIGILSNHMKESNKKQQSTPITAQDRAAGNALQRNEALIKKKVDELKRKQLAGEDVDNAEYLKSFDMMVDNFAKTLARYEITNERELEAILKDILRLRPLLVDYHEQLESIQSLEGSGDYWVDKNKLSELIKHYESILKANQAILDYLKNIGENREKALVRAGVPKAEARKKAALLSKDGRTIGAISIRSQEKIIIENNIIALRILRDYWGNWEISEGAIVFNSKVPIMQQTLYINALNKVEEAEKETLKLLENSI